MKAGRYTKMIDEKIQEYAERFTSDESGVLSEIRKLTDETREDKSMLSGFYQGRLLSMMSKIARPKLVLEIGTFMGYSTLCLAEGLAEGGKVITLDIEEDTNAIARSFWSKTEFADVIEDHLIEAVDFIPAMDQKIDLVFIDADKENYPNYFELVIQKMNPGGLIIADNVLWSGDVLNVESGKTDRPTSIALYDYVVKVNSDPRVTNLLMPVRDGLMVSRVN